MVPVTEGAKVGGEPDEKTKDEMLRLLNKAIKHVEELSFLKSEMEKKQVGRWEKMINTMRRHVQGLLNLRSHIESERDDLLASMNTERSRGEKE